MSDLQITDTDYSVLVTFTGGIYELRIRELLLCARNAELQKGYEELIERKKRIIDWARESDAVDELPLPLPPPPISAVCRVFDLIRRIPESLDRMAKKYF